LFFHAEKVNIDAKCAALDEHLPEAIHCYNQAIKGYTKEGENIERNRKKSVTFIINYKVERNGRSKD